MNLNRTWFLITEMFFKIEHGANQHTKHLTEYFAFLLEFAKMGSRECQFLLSIEAISTINNFYLGHKAGDYVIIIILHALCVLLLRVNVIWMF